MSYELKLPAKPSILPVTTEESEECQVKFYFCFVAPYTELWASGMTIFIIEALAWKIETDVLWSANWTELMSVHGVYLK